MSTDVFAYVALNMYVCLYGVSVSHVFVKPRLNTLLMWVNHHFDKKHSPLRQGRLNLYNLLFSSQFHNSTKLKHLSNLSRQKLAAFTSFHLKPFKNDRDAWHRHMTHGTYTWHRQMTQPHNTDTWHMAHDTNTWHSHITRIHDTWSRHMAQAHGTGTCHNDADTCYRHTAQTHQLCQKRMDKSQTQREALHYNYIGRFCA